MQHKTALVGRFWLEYTLSLRTIQIKSMTSSERFRMENRNLPEGLQLVEL